MVTDPTEAHFKGGPHGWDGTQWRKQPLIFAYSDRIAGRVAHTHSGAGDYELEIVACPAGSIYVVNAIATRNQDKSVQQRIMAKTNATYVPLIPFETPAINVWSVSGFVVFILKEGDSIICSFQSCADGDELQAGYWGYEMKIAE